jgi:CheY-like chemotaxis protein
MNEPQHIVIIDDDLVIAGIIKNLLEEQGYRATTLRALSTIDDLTRLDADCFIIDENLPFVNGHIICLMLKSRPGTRHIPIILVSASDALEGYADQCKAEAYYKKPYVNIHDLIALVTRTVESAAAL